MMTEADIPHHPENLVQLAKAMRANSQRWFPRWHDGSSEVPLRVAWALGLSGEVGEVANVVKKQIRDGRNGQLDDALGAELADVFVYLLLLADECGVDLIAEYEAKVKVNDERWNPR